MKNIFIIISSILFLSSWINFNSEEIKYPEYCNSDVTYSQLITVDSCGCPQLEKVKLFAIWGQSLADGSADASCLPTGFGAPITNGTNTAFKWTSSGFSTLEFGVNNATDLTEWGVEIPLGWDFVSNNEDVYVVKTASNGAPLCDDPARQDWHMPNEELFDNFLNNIEDARENLRAQGKEPEICIISKQGEADAGDPNCAANYETALALHYDEIFRALGDSDIRVFSALLHDNLPASYTDWTTVNTARTNVCNALNDCVLINTDVANGYSYESDNIHWDCGGVLQYWQDIKALL